MKRHWLSVPKGAQLVFLLFFSAGTFFSQVCYGHTIVLSEFTLEYKNDKWLLYFDQKTSQLRDAIYAENPDLKGMNLNSEDVLDATSRFVQSNLTLISQGKELQIEPYHMHYGGLKFESRFKVEGLSSSPEFLTIKVDGFDIHEHSIVLFRVVEEGEGHLNYFNQNQSVANFDFAAKTYIFEEVEANRSYEFILYVAIFILLTAAAIKYYRTNRRVLDQGISA